MGFFYPFIGSKAIAAVVLGLIPFAAASTDFVACLREIQSGAFGPDGGTDNHGNPVSNISVATGITFDLCVRACGAGPEAFKWPTFSQQFTSWLLPWLALVSQLPFGTHDMLENFISMLLTLGSPTLAAYTLALSAYNVRWINHRFARCTHERREYAITILNNLQQSAVRVTDRGGVFTALLTLEQNNGWWTMLARQLDYVQTWSLSAVTTMLWVAIAYIFTLIEAFTEVQTFSTINATGQGVGSIWLWLLPVVLLWLRVSPKCDATKLGEALGDANAIAYVDVEGLAEPQLVNNRIPLQHAISISPYDPNDTLRHDEHYTAPIYNYARFLPWSHAVEDALEILLRNQVNTPVIPPRGRWGCDMWPRFLVASVAALFLQWGTTGAAIIASWFSPTIGLGCRSLSFLLYGGTSTAIWIMFVLAHFLSHFATTPAPRNTFPARAARSLSICIRRLAKVLAGFNAIWVVVLCIFQFSKFFDRCWCNSCVIWLGDRAFSVIQYEATELSRMRRGWTGGVALAAGSTLMYAGYLYMILMLPP